MEGIISSIKHMPNPGKNEYYVTTLSKRYPQLFLLNSAFVSSIYSSVNFENGKIIGNISPELKKEKYIKSIKATAGKLIRKNADGIKSLEEITLRMKPKIVSAVKELIEKSMLGVPILIRFHNDADGLGGAYAIYKSLAKLYSKKYFAAKPTVLWRMHRGVFYAKEDAENDILSVNNYETISKPLLFIIDFGTSSESNKGIEAASKTFDIIWLDHHPIEQGFEGINIEHYINPWLFGGDSNYTAGYLAARFARYMSEVDTSIIEQASLIGDYSTFAEPSENSKELAMLFDLVTSDTHVIGASNNISPEEIDSVLSHEKKKRELLSYARSRLSESIDMALRSVKQYKSKDANVYVVNFANVRNDNEGRYPLPGRFASKLLEHIEKLNNKPSILVLHFGVFISIRASKQLSNTVDILSKVRDMKRDYSAIESAGGHASALSIKLKDESAKATIIKAILRNIECAV